MAYFRTGGGGSEVKMTYTSQSVNNGSNTSAIKLDVGDVLAVKQPAGKLVYKKNGGSQTTDTIAGTSITLTVLSSGNFETLTGHQTYGMSFLCLKAGSYVFTNSSGAAQVYVYPVNN